MRLQRRNKNRQTLLPKLRLINKKLWGLCQCTQPHKRRKIKMSTHALITISKDKELKDYEGTYVHMDGYG